MYIYWNFPALVTKFWDNGQHWRGELTYLTGSLLYNQLNIHIILLCSGEENIFCQTRDTLCGAPCNDRLPLDICLHYTQLEMDWCISCTFLWYVSVFFKMYRIIIMNILTVNCNAWRTTDVYIGKRFGWILTKIGTNRIMDFGTQYWFSDCSILCCVPVTWLKGAAMLHSDRSCCGVWCHLIADIVPRCFIGLIFTSIEWSAGLVIMWIFIEWAWRQPWMDEGPLTPPH
jgi:hypothetical protein